MQGCFRSRRHDAVVAVEALHGYMTAYKPVSTSLCQRLQNGGNARFVVSPRYSRRSHELTIGTTWLTPEPHSPAMMESLEWMVVHLCLGKEIPLWGPVTGVWFDHDDWESVLSQADALLGAGNAEWAQFPAQSATSSMTTSEVRPFPSCSSAWY